MSETKELTDSRRATNPIFNDRKLKLGMFCMNLSGASTMSTMEGVLEVSWPTMTHLAGLAEEMDFEAIVPVGRWRGLGGKTDYNGTGFESFTFAAAMAARTKYPALFATSHVPSIHPIMAAKQASTIDHISGGRFALNVVTGWHKTEIEMFGSPMMEHDMRYDAAAEWLEIIKLVWQADKPFDYEGKFYQVRQALLKPQPVQKPFPAVMGAGASSKGRHFAAKHCDITFTTTDQRGNLEEISAAMNAPRKLAFTEYGRDLKVWTQAYVIVGDTEEDARKLYNYCIEHADNAAVDSFLKILGVNSQTWSPEGIKRMREDFILGFGGLPLVGTKEQVVEGLARLANAGTDGVLLTWPDYVNGAHRFQKEVMPLLIQTGLR